MPPFVWGYSCSTKYTTALFVFPSLSPEQCTCNSFLSSEAFYGSESSHKWGQSKGPMVSCSMSSWSRWLWGEYTSRMCMLVTAVLPTCYLWFRTFRLQVVSLCSCGPWNFAALQVAKCWHSRKSLSGDSVVNMPKIFNLNSNSCFSNKQFFSKPNLDY